MGNKVKLSRRGFISCTSAITAGLSVGGRAMAAIRKARPVNLLFIMTDQQRWDAMSCAGNTCFDTPNIDRLAREGVRFENVMSGCPVCVPARTVILTGHSIETTGVRSNADLGPDVHVPVPTFDNILAENGYTTEYYGKWHAPYHMTSTYANKVLPIVGKMAGKDVQTFSAAYAELLAKNVPKKPLGPGEIWERGGTASYLPDPIDERYHVDPKDVPKRKNGRPNVSQAGEYGWLKIPDKYTRTSFCAGQVLESLGRIKDEPFSLTCSFGPPHPPMILPKPYYGMYPHDQMPVPKSINDKMDNSPYRARALGKSMQRYKNPKTIGYMLSDYYGLIKEVDNWVGTLLDRLDQYGIADRTLVVFTSDHGEMLGDHGMNSKMVFYEGSVHVPLLMRLPNVIPAGKVVDAPVSHIDYFATILDYLDMPKHESHGRSLRPLIEGTHDDGPDYCVSEWKSGNTPNLMVRTKRWKLMMANKSSSSSLDALYDLDQDPLEMNNLIGHNPDKKRYIKQATAMKNRLVEWLKRTGSPYLDEVESRRI